MAIQPLNAFFEAAIPLGAATAICSIAGYRAYQHLAPESKTKVKQSLPYFGAMVAIVAGAALYSAYQGPALLQKPPSMFNRLSDAYENLPIWDRISDAANCYRHFENRLFSRHPFCSPECMEYHQFASTVEKIARPLIGLGVEFFRSNFR